MSTPKEEKRENPLTAVWNGMQTLARRLNATDASVRDNRVRIGAARPLASSEVGSHWREIQIGDQVLRVVVIPEPEQ